MAGEFKPACQWCWTVLRLRYACACKPRPAEPPACPPAPFTEIVPLAEFRRRAILAVLQRVGTLTQTAKVLGVDLGTIRRFRHLPESPISRRAA